MEEMRAHYADDHPNAEIPKSFVFSLDWLVVLPGLDHFRLNSCKAIVKRYWDIYFRSVCIQLGYTSPKALNYAFSCGDLHKSTQILACFMEAGAQELAKIYFNETQNYSTEGFVTFLKNNVNKNIILLREAVFRDCLGYFILLAGIRRNFDYFMTGKCLVSPLFFVGNHPFYRKVCLYFDYAL